VAHEAFRGEVWDVDFADFGEHPAVVISTNDPNAQLGHVAVVVVTGTTGPETTHLPLTTDAGLTRYDESYADVTSLQPVDKEDLLRQRGRLAQVELGRIEAALRVYLGL
jgi:mRNA interferase MazF